MLKVRGEVMRGRRREGIGNKLIFIIIPIVFIVLFLGLSLRKDKDTIKEISVVEKDENAYIQWNIDEDKITSLNETYLSAEQSSNYLYGVSIGVDKDGEYLFADTMMKEANVQVFEETIDSVITICLPYMDTDLNMKAGNLGSNILSVSTDKTNNLLIIKMKFESLPEYKIEKKNHRLTIRFQETINQETSANKSNDGALILRKENGVSIDDVTETNDIFNKQLTLTVSKKIDKDSMFYGNGYKYYITEEKGKSTVHQEIRKVSSVFHIDVNEDTSETSFQITADRFLEYIYSEDANYIYIKPVSPREKYGRLVVIDPGHGGDLWPGAVYKGIIEKEVNLAFAMELKKLTERQEDIKFYYLRTEDVDVTLDQRVALTNELEPDMFISMHCNANDYNYVKGTEVFYADNIPNDKEFNGKVLAEHVYENLAKTLDSKGRGALETEDYRVVVKSNVPAILIELGYMTNSEELKKLSDIKYLEKAAGTLFQTILEIYNMYEMD